MSVDYHLSKYKEIVEDLQKEITHLKSKLASHGPTKGVFDKVEAARLKALMCMVAMAMYARSWQRQSVVVNC